MAAPVPVYPYPAEYKPPPIPMAAFPPIPAYPTAPCVSTTALIISFIAGMIAGFAIAYFLIKYGYLTV